MNPWQEKNNIDVALDMADRNGFKLVQGRTENICIQVKGANEHGFTNDTTLQSFTDWYQVIMFLAGWEKHELAIQLGKVRK